MATIYTVVNSARARIVRGAVIAGLGAGAVVTAEQLTHADWGQWTPVVGAIASIAINAIHVWLSSSTTPR